MSTYLVLLGHTPQLSLAELQAVVKDQQLEDWSQHLTAISLDNDEQAQQLQSLLGGAYKILKLINSISATPQKSLDEIAQYLAEQTHEKILFGLTTLGSNQLQLSPTDLKKKLQTQDLKARYREAETWGLSTAILSHQEQVFDLFVISHQDQYYLAQTVAFQDVENWVKRDRNKPYTSGKKGMLPPKLARIMVNLGLGQPVLLNSKQEPTLYDPFCGSGTVLIEALLRGCAVIGSDIDEQAVAGTLKNLYWFEQEYQFQAKYDVFQADVAHLDQQEWQTQVDLIVTEPFLGKPNPKPTQLKNIFTGLRSIYLSAFKAWTKILAPQAVVVIVFPQVKTDTKTYDLLDLIDKIADYGYTLQVDAIDYGYTSAIVKRQILVFTYNS